MKQHVYIGMKMNSLKANIRNTNTSAVTYLMTQLLSGKYCHLTVQFPHKDMQVRRIGELKLPVGLSVNVCMSVLAL